MLVPTRWLFFIFFFPILSFAQVQKHPSLLEGHVFLNRFQQAQANEKTLYNPGIGITYIHGCTRRLDWLAGFDGSFTDAVVKMSASDQKKLLQEWKGSLRWRMAKWNNQPFHPYITASAGITLFSGKANALVAPGLGLQAKIKSLYFFLNAEYKTAVTKELIDHWCFNVGIGGLLSRKQTSILPKQ